MNPTNSSQAKFQGSLRIQTETANQITHKGFYVNFKNSLIIHEQNTKEIIAVKESLYVIKHT